jgi:hypothetical protein
MGRLMRPFTSSGALRESDDDRAARGGGRADSLGKGRKRFLAGAIFVLRRCAIVRRSRSARN